ncbi:MAG: radical SAM protein [DPANN group archaeon]|nr:radical SAM protein [DPANN group archaeon]
MTHLTDEQFSQILGNVRLRYSLTPQCNIWCLFCSNEGLGYNSKKNKPADLNLLRDLGDLVLNNSPLNKIDFSGGEPTLHPDFVKEEFKLIEWAEKYPKARFSLHSNGIELTPRVIDRIKSPLARIGVSVNSFNFDVWKKITDMNGRFGEDIQRKRFDKLMRNLDYLASQGVSEKVFVKAVITRGLNDSEKELELFLQRTAQYGFHPKLLQFDPQYPSQKGMVVERGELFQRLEAVGCKFTSDTPRKNEPDAYIPGVNFIYEGNGRTLTGLHSIFGCGEKGACLACYDFACIFVKPSEDGSGIYIKPCSVIDKRFDLTAAVKRKNAEEVLQIIKSSREYLMTTPGMGVSGWNKEKAFEAAASGRKNEFRS